MSQYITDLKKDILNDENLTKTLRKAFLISDELGLNEFKEWIKLELNGYGGHSFNEIPNYRILSMELKCNSKQIALGGLYDISNMSILGLPEEFTNSLTNVPILDSIPQLLTLVNQQNHIIKIKLDNKMEYLLNQYISESKTSLPEQSSITEIYGVGSTYQIKGIIEQVKNELLFWTSQLESNGIKGVNNNFSNEEKQTAKTINYNFNFNIISNSTTNIHINQKYYKNQIIKELSSINNILGNNDIKSNIKENISENILEMSNELNQNSPNINKLNKLGNNILEFIKQITISSIVELLMPHILNVLLTISNFI